MGESILVTGGAGFIGSHLVDRLLVEGHRVRVLDNLEPQVHGDLNENKQWPSYCNPDADYVFGDVRDRNTVYDAIKDVDVVFHLAAAVGVGQSMYEINHYVDVNIGGTATLLDIIANERTIRNRLRKLIVASSMSNYGEGEYECPIHGTIYPTLRSRSQLDKGQWELFCGTKMNHEQECCEIIHPVATRETKPPYTNSIYAITKKAQEDMCLTIGGVYQIPSVALRFFNTYGTRQALSNPYTGVVANFSSRLLNGNEPMIFEDGNQMRDFVHVTDVVQANILIMEHEKVQGIYNVGSGEPISILNVANTIAKYLDNPLRAKILHEYRVGDIRHCYADISKLVALGFKPQIDFESGVGEFVLWIQDQKAVDSFDLMKTSLTKRGLTI